MKRKSLIILDLITVNFIRILTYFEDFKALNHQIFRFLAISKGLLTYVANIGFLLYLFTSSLTSGKETSRVNMPIHGTSFLPLAGGRIVSE
jgi:hypothetical protein